MSAAGVREADAERAGHGHRRHRAQRLHAAGAEAVGLGEDRQARALGVQHRECAGVEQLAAPGAAQHHELTGPGASDGGRRVGLELEGEVAAAEPGVGRDARFKLSRGHARGIGQRGPARKVQTPARGAQTGVTLRGGRLPRSVGTPLVRGLRGAARRRRSA